MNILLAPVGSHGDVHPFVGVGLALQARGHAIALIANEAYRPLAEKHAFEFAPVGTVEEFQRMTDDPMLWHPSKSLRAVFNDDLVRKYMPLTFAAIESRFVPGNTVLLAGSLNFAARIANEKLGIPFVTVHLQPISIHSVDAPPKFPSRMQMTYFPKWLRRASYWYAEKHILDGYLAAPVNDFRKTVGLPPIRRVWGKWRHSPQRILGLFPKWFASAPDWPAPSRRTSRSTGSSASSASAPACLI